MIKYLFLSTLITFNCYANDLEVICSTKDCYKVVREIGEGAFGKVYEVKNKKKKKFALKSYKPTEDGGEWWNALADVEREFKRGQELDHANIIRSVELFSQGASNYLVLQFVKGEPLFKVQRKSISIDESLKGAIQFVEALRYGATLDLYHLDLHEGNVMLSGKSGVMVVDLASFFTLEEIAGFFKTPRGIAQPKKLKEFFEKNPELKKKVKRARVDTSVYDSFRKDFTQHYFDRITNMCINILKKSDLNREERIELQAEIKKLAWNYNEDVVDGLETDFNAYVDKLLEVLVTFLDNRRL